MSLRLEDVDDCFFSGLLVVAEVEEDVVLEVVDDGGVSSEPDSESDLDAATMMGGVDSNADENSPDRLRNRLIVKRSASCTLVKDLARTRVILSHASAARSVN